MTRVFFIFIAICSSFVLVAQGYTTIKVTEIMYNAPSSGGINGNSFDFIELKNTGGQAVDLSGFYFASGINYTFPVGSVVNPGQFVVLVSDVVNFSSKYPTVSFFGQYTGILSNKGALLQLTAPNPVDTFIRIPFNDNLPWPILADGNGYSIVPVITNPINSQKKAKHWRASSVIGGSPGTDDSTPPIFPEIIITECLSNPAPPAKDAVELYNASAASVNIGGWYLTDNRNSPFKYKIPQGTVINPGQYLVFDATQFRVGLTGFSFSRVGDFALLFSADINGNLSGYATGYQFGAQYEGTSFGRWINSQGKIHFVAQKSTTLGLVNDSPKVGPIVITHINYNPLVGVAPAPSHEEYLVLQNITDTVVQLFYNHLGVVIPDTTWKVKGVGFRFPPNVSLQPKEYVILTSSTEAFFRSQNVIPPTVKVYQYFGKLNNKGENVQVLGREQMDTIIVTGQIYAPYVVIDAVNYKDTVPWPIYSDGTTGKRLDRIIDAHFGSEPINWGESDGGSFGFLTATSVEKLNNNSDVVVYPNPVTNTVNFSAENTINKVVIYTIDGRLILQQNNYEKIVLVSVNKWSSGVYFYEVYLDSQLIKGKLIKE